MIFQKNKLRKKLLALLYEGKLEKNQVNMSVGKERKKGACWETRDNSIMIGT